MKKTTLAVTIVSLLTFGATSAAIAQGNHEVEKNIQIKMDKNDTGEATLEIKHNGDVDVFEFTSEELQNPDVLAERLENLDDQTRSLVLSAVNGVDIEFNSDGDNRVMVLHKNANATAHAVSNAIRHKIVEEFETDGNQRIKIKLDGDKSSVDVIKHMIENGKLTQEQLDAIEAKLNNLRAL